MRKSAKDRSGVLELLEIANRVERLAKQAFEEPQSYRISGRLARDSHDVGALFEAIVASAKGPDAIFPMIEETPTDYALFHRAMWHVSMLMWEELWNGAHPDQFGLASEGEDFALMPVWREKARTMVTECRQGAIFVMTPAEYFDKLIRAGVSEQDAKTLVEWRLEIQEGAPPLYLCRDEEELKNENQ